MQWDLLWWINTPTIATTNLIRLYVYLYKDMFETGLSCHRGTHIQVLSPEKPRKICKRTFQKLKSAYEHIFSSTSIFAYWHTSIPYESIKKRFVSFNKLMLELNHSRCIYRFFLITNFFWIILAIDPVSFEAGIINMQSYRMRTRCNNFERVTFLFLSNITVSGMRYNRVWRGSIVFRAL